jgi:hypothetical protein
MQTIMEHSSEAFQNKSFMINIKKKLSAEKSLKLTVFHREQIKNSLVNLFGKATKYLSVYKSYKRKSLIKINN